MKNHLKKPKFLSIFIILSAIIAVILSSCGGGEGNIGISSTPTLLPTQHPAGDPFYDHISMQIVNQKIEWEEKLNSKEEAVKKIVDWMNGKIVAPPLPQEIKDSVANVEVDYYNAKSMWIYYKDGYQVFVNGDPPFFSLNDDTLPKSKSLPVEISEDISTNNTQKATTVKNFKVLILAPHDCMFAFACYNPSQLVSHSIKDELTNLGFDVKCRATYNMDVYFMPQNADPNIIDFPASNIKDITYGYSYYDDKVLKKNPELRIVPAKMNFSSLNIVRPYDYYNMDQYGVIYISTHGSERSISSCLYYANDQRLNSWLDSNRDLYYIALDEYPTGLMLRNDEKDETVRYTKSVTFKREFFQNMNFKESIVFINACKSMKLRETYYYKWLGISYASENPIFTDAKAYIGYSNIASGVWATPLSYYFFRYLMYKYERPDDNTFKSDDISKRNLSDPNELKYEMPHSVREAINVFKYFSLDKYKNFKDPDKHPDCNIELKTSTDEEIYLPANVKIIVNK